MADINVERKGPSVWPWILGLIVLALLVWAFIEMFDAEPATPPPPPAAVDTSAIPS
ncbi:MAG: hypothetical protein WD737_14025 [Gemmatimonadota bacterium]